MVMIKKYVSFIALILLISIIGRGNVQAMEDKEEASKKGNIHRLINKASAPQEVKFQLGVHSFKPFVGKQPEEFESFAESGSNVIKSTMGLIYFIGYMVPQDEEKAFLWFEKSGMGAGAYMAGQLCEGKKGYNKAQKWYNWAALRGYFDAQLKCADCAFTKGDHKTACFWFAKVGETGLLESQYEAGWFAFDKAVFIGEINIKKAYLGVAFELFMKAFNNGLSEAKKNEALEKWENIFYAYKADGNLELASIYRDFANLLRDIPTQKKD